MFLFHCRRNLVSEIFPGPNGSDYIPAHDDAAEGLPGHASSGIARDLKLNGNKSASMPVIHYEHHKGWGTTLQTAIDTIRAMPDQQDFMEISDPSVTRSRSGLRTI
jgi:hypothetical protein